MVNHAWVPMKSLLVYSAFAVTLSVNAAIAETVTVKYRGDVPLDTFQCQDISRSSFIERICHDGAEDYMVIRLKGTYYHYCEIGVSDVESLLAAPSMGKYFNAIIKGNGASGPFDCRTRRVPTYQ